MKKETVTKANELIKRIDYVESYATGYSAINCCDKIEPDDPGLLRRTIDVSLNLADFTELEKIVTKFLKNKKAQLQKQFDQLK